MSSSAGRDARTMPCAAGLVGAQRQRFAPFFVKYDTIFFKIRHSVFFSVFPYFISRPLNQAAHRPNGLGAIGVDAGEHELLR